MNASTELDKNADTFHDTLANEINDDEYDPNAITMIIKNKIFFAHGPQIDDLDINDKTKIKLSIKKINKDGEDSSGTSDITLEYLPPKNKTGGKKTRKTHKKIKLKKNNRKSRR
jgi:hypothetical protein